MINTCKECGKDFNYKSKRKFCSRACFFDYSRGKERPSMKGRKSWNAVDKPTREDLYRLHNVELASATDIAAMYSVQPQTVRGWIHDYGIPLRSRIRETQFKKNQEPANKVAIPNKRDLRKLYKSGKSAAEIGDIYSVTGTTVLKWLEGYGINRRQMRNQAGWEPDAELLEELYWKKWMSYEQIADKFGVDLTAVPYWFRKFGIKRRTLWETRRGPNWTPPDLDSITHLYQAEKMGMQSIGDMFGVSSTYISGVLKEKGIPIRRSGYPNVSHYTAKDGHKVKSGLELQVDDWLFDNGVQHEYEPRIPDSSYKSDFLAAGHYIEVWGISGNERYEKRRNRKLAIYQRQSLPLISVYPSDFPHLFVLNSLLAK